MYVYIYIYMNTYIPVRPVIYSIPSVPGYHSRGDGFDLIDTPAENGLSHG